MHLEEYAALGASVLQCFVRTNHSELNDICGRSLDRGIHRHALRKCALVEVVALDGW